MPPMPTDPVSPKPMAMFVLPRGGGHVQRGQSGFGVHGAGIRVDVQRAHVAQVDHQATLCRAVAGGAVSTAADGELQPARPCHLDDAGDVVWPR